MRPPSKKRLDLFEGYKEEDELFDVPVGDNGEKREQYLNADQQLKAY